MSTPKKFIYEAAFIRPIVILLLVIYHAFIIYQGGWSEPEGFEPNKAYWWISKLSYAFMLETFVFISGYIFALQLPKFEPNFGGGKLLVTNKLKRLILPSILFSIIYVVLFYTYESPIKTLYAILNGAGHMWFLPMLFWCFLFAWGLQKLPLNNTKKMIILLGAALISFLPLPLRLANAMYYLLFFYGGMLIFKQKDRIAKILTLKKIVLFWVAFLGVFVALTLLRTSLMEGFEHADLVKKVLFFSASKMCQILYAGLGVWAIYSTALYFTSKHQLSEGVIKIGGYCMCVYIFQQFILQILYYKTSLPILLGSNWLPWVATIITLILSILGTIILKKLPLAKELI